MSEIFKDCECAIIIFDNILICASGYDELYKRIDIALDLCIKYNVILKMGKTWLGFPEVKFFGYICRKGSYELAADRKVALNQIPFPTSTKSVQSFPGFALFFKPFVSQYSLLAAPLNDMVHTGTVSFGKSTIVQLGSHSRTHAITAWDYTTMILHCPSLFVRMLQRKLVSVQSCYKFGSCLMGRSYWNLLFVLWLCSAFRTTIEQECFAIYFAILTFAYFLYGNVFTIETDHNNLRWMEMS
jgi:hypothetical protein